MDNKFYSADPKDHDDINLNTWDKIFDFQSEKEGNDLAKLREWLKKYCEIPKFVGEVAENYKWKPHLDIDLDAHKIYPISLVLAKSFPPNGLDFNGKDRNNYIKGRVDERAIVGKISYEDMVWFECPTCHCKCTDSNYIETHNCEDYLNK